MTTTTTTTTTMRPKRSELCVCACSMLYLVALAPLLVCQGFQLQRQQHLSLLSSSNNNKNNNNNRWYSSSSSSSSSLSVGADYFQEDNVLQSTDIGIDAALGSVGGAHYVSEYERDADFYKRRNEAYYYSLKDKDMNDNGNNNSNNNTDNDDNKDVEIVEPSLLKASHSSFKHIESLTNSLLTTNPLVAIAIFAVSGVLIAYLSGFFFLEGYIENWNPVENDMIPYWNDAEIHTIQRALPPH